MNGFKALKCKVMSVFISLEAVVFLIRDSDWGRGGGREGNGGVIKKVLHRRILPRGSSLQAKVQAKKTLHCQELLNKFNSSDLCNIRCQDMMETVFKTIQFETMPKYIVVSFK